jgi:O-antigen/teichoic acid export membrane protein
MSTEEYGIAELVNNLSEFLFPLLCLAVYEAVFRFLMEENASKGDLLTCGFTVLLSAMPIGAIVAGIAFWVFSYELAWPCLALAFAMSLRMILAQFARGSGEVKVFAFAGVLNALLLLLASAVLLVLFDGGVLEYITALVVGNIGAALYIFFACRVWAYMGGRPNIKLIGRMLKYSLPMLPNQLAWWFLNIFGRYTIMAVQGPVMAGIYTAATKFPAMVNFMSTIFRQAWQISATQEIDSGDGSDYFSKVFSMFFAFVLCGTALVVALTEPLAALLLKGEFYEGWKIIPLLMLAALVGCISVFFEAFYSAAERTNALFVSSLAGALVNIALALALVSPFGVWGVAVATLMGQVVNTGVRILDSRRLVHVKFDLSSQITMAVIVVAQTAVVSALPPTIGLVIGLILFSLLLVVVVHRYGRAAKALIGVIRRAIAYRH